MTDAAMLLFYAALVSRGHNPRPRPLPSLRAKYATYATYRKIGTLRNIKDLSTTLLALFGVGWHGSKDANTPEGCQEMCVDTLAHFGSVRIGSTR